MKQALQVVASSLEWASRTGWDKVFADWAVQLVSGLLVAYCAAKWAVRGVARDQAAAQQVREWILDAEAEHRRVFTGAHAKLNPVCTGTVQMETKGQLAAVRLLRAHPRVASVRPRNPKVGDELKFVVRAGNDATDA